MSEALPQDVQRRLAQLSPAKRELLAREVAGGRHRGHEWVARALAAGGVSTVYGVPGTPVYATFAACVERGLRAIGTRHQQAATLMATAHNYCAGHPAAVALVSSGPAASNALTGAIVARDNAWPLLLLAGAVPREPGDFGQFSELDVEALYRPVAKWTTTVQSTSDLARVIPEALATTMRGRPGPVVVALPADVLDASSFGCESSVGEPALPSPIDAGDIDRAASILLGARRPLLILGKGARWNDAYEVIDRLVHALALPFVTSPMARGYLPDRHPHCYNAVRWDAQREADVVLLLGARLDWTFRHGTQVGRDASIVQVDVHAAELHRNRVAAHAVHGDLSEFALRLLGCVTAVGYEPASRDHGWVERLRSRRTAALASDAGEPRPTDAAPISPTGLARALAAALPADAITVFDGNLVLAACERHVAAQHPVHRLTPGSNGCLGSGIPFAIGAALARPARRVVAVCGDFAFGISAFEMETAVRHRVPIVVVVANNDGNSGALREREMFPHGHHERVSMFAPRLRYSEIMRTFGGHAEHVERIQDVVPAVQRALAANGPACVDVAVDPDAAFPRG